MSQEHISQTQDNPPPAPPQVLPSTQSQQQQQQQQPPKDEPVKRSHKCSSCNCDKQRFYERGNLFKMKNASGTYIIQYQGFECASCGFLMPFKTSETAQGF